MKRISMLKKNTVSRAAALALCLALFLAWTFPLAAAAADPDEFPDLDRPGSITATFT